MTDVLWLFFVGLLTSFVGSIPPGTLNLSVLQLGLDGKTKIAWRFALAVTLIEYPYTWLAIQFERWITSNPMVAQNFQLITAMVVTLLGIVGLLAARKPSRFTERIESSGFRRGLVLSILNPIAIPWWTGMIAYEKAQGWIAMSSTLQIHSYVFGTAIGVLILLGLFILLSKWLAGYANQNAWVKMLPSLILLVLGLIAFWNYFVG
jgi:threonine/homoserine/homoserine lactone efflux protein